MKLKQLFRIWGCLLYLQLLIGTNVLLAQDKTLSDTVFFLANKKGIWGKIGKGLSVNNPEPVFPVNGAVKNQNAFEAYRGKAIRYIFIQKQNFERSVNDTNRVVRNIFNSIGDALHPSTANRVILNNLFFNEGDTLYPALLADNERYLRQLSYLQDARITVRETGVDSNSVDVIIICKDVFPLGGSIDEGSPSTVSFEVNDDNLVGTGNRIRFMNYYDMNRNPRYGWGAEFMKRNLWGSFLDLAVGYQNQAPAYNSGRREETSIYLNGSMPLVSPYHSWTGGFEIAKHYTQNLYLSDSLYNSDYKYHYRVFDGWIGHNLGARKTLRENLPQARLRRLLAIRGIHRIYSDMPDAAKSGYDIRYSDLVSVLGTFTLFEQDFYHTNFLYGFGRNEDVPEGFRIAITGGWSKRDNVSRPYLSFEYDRAYFSRRKNYWNYSLRGGAFYNNSRIEDISVLASFDYFTRLRKLGKGNWFLRHFISGSATQLINTVQNEPLRLSSDYGIPQLYDPELKASSRITFNAESVFYNTWKLAGFSFAPFYFANVTYMKRIGFQIESGDIFTAVGGGVRTRNENLVFGTMELRVFYYPRPTATRNPWNISFNTNLKYKYESQLVKRPDFVIVN
jgi:hypothetical protein